jgi:hypothetical protein
MADQSETQGVPDLCKEPQSKILVGRRHVEANHHAPCQVPLVTVQHELPLWDCDTTAPSRNARDGNERPLQLYGNGTQIQGR